MDIAINAKNFPILCSKITGSHVLKSIRLLCIFGCNGAEVIFATIDDMVFGYGRNRFGGLGLGHEEENLERPQLNHTLSYKQLEDIYCGFEHWIARTAGGQCYAWGHNTSGQLAIDGIDSTATPQLISTLVYERVSQLSCGAYHTLALTTDGRVLSWGDNTYGQLGEGSTTNHVIPRLVPIKEQVIAISCGRSHSMALTISRRVYVWGLNSHSQLGFKSNAFFSSRPELIPSLETTIFSKIICGPNYSLLLTSDGNIYGFGDNSCGQIGNGSSAEFQSMPFKINSEVKFKEIIAHKENDISIAVSMDDKFYVWGLAKNRRHLIPERLTDSSRDSSFDVYAKYCKKIVTYKTIVINDGLKSWETVKRNFVSDNEEEDNETEDNCYHRNGSTDSEETTNTETLKEDSWHQISKSVKRLKHQTMTLDKVLDLKMFVKNTSIIDDFMRKNIRLFKVFGIYGMKVIFATNEDKVYAFGHNKDKCLGVGTNEVHVLRPQVIKELSGKKVMDIASGYEHCIALTADGQCFGWGLNDYGQIGNGTIITSNRPQFIDELVDKRVIKIKCGAYHSLALTSDGDLFSWGHNTFAQLGDRTYNSRERPTQVMVTEVIVDIACGNNHNIALTKEGQVYVWGSNEVGQLGRPPEMDVRISREKPMSNRPHLLVKLENVFIVKAVCGANHTILLSRNGDIYAFGDNSCGQVGNGTTNPQYNPIKLNNKDIKFKDIISDFDNDITFAVDVNDKYFVWGFALKKKILRPQEVKSFCGTSLYNIYANLAKNKVTFNTVIVGEDIKSNYIENKVKTKPKQMIKESKAENRSAIVSNVCDAMDVNSNVDINRKSQDLNKDIGLSEKNERIVANYWTELHRSFTPFGDRLRDQSMPPNDNLSNDSTSKTETVSGNKFLIHLRKAFNDPNDYDLKIRSEDQVIYCHKKVIQIRNEKFWQTLRTELKSDYNEIVIKSNTYHMFYAFIQFLYAIEPQIDARFAEDLKRMAKLFGEPELSDMCGDWPQENGHKVVVNLSNVCALYEKALKEELSDLEKTCVEFAANNWKSVMKSKAFDSMEESISKRLLISIVK